MDADRNQVIAGGRSRIFKLSIDKWNIKFKDMIDRAKSGWDPFEKPFDHAKEI